jgi:hypothetical protein
MIPAILLEPGLMLPAILLEPGLILLLSFRAWSDDSCYSVRALFILLEPGKMLPATMLEPGLMLTATLLRLIWRFWLSCSSLV